MRSLIGEKIESSGLRKGYIAKEIGITSQQLSNWIAGRSFPTLQKAFQLAKLLNCKIDDLYEEEQKEN